MTTRRLNINEIPEARLMAAMNAHTVTNDFCVTCGSWLEMIEIAQHHNNGDPYTVWIIRCFLDTIKVMRSNCVPGLQGADRAAQEEEVWGWYREQVKVCTTSYFEAMSQIKEDHDESDFNPDTDGLHSSIGAVFNRNMMRQFGDQTAHRWSNLTPVQRTGVRIQYEALYEWRTFEVATITLQRLLDRILLHKYSFDVSRKRFVFHRFVSNRKANPEDWRVIENDQTDIYALYKATVNARAYVDAKVAPFIVDGQVQTLKAVIAGKQAWAEYWALTIPAIPLLQSRKASASCECRLCQVAKTDVVPALAGWLRSNAASSVSRQIIAGLRRDGIAPGIGYFYDLMGELEVRASEGQACFCRVPQLRNETISRVRKMYPSGSKIESLDDQEREIQDSARSVEGQAIGKLTEEEFLAEAQRLLAPRELQVFDLLLTGATYAEVSAALNIKVGTVGATVSRIREKLKDLESMARSSCPCSN